MSSSSNPHRLRRLSRVFDSAPSYFVTFCTDNRIAVLNQNWVMNNTRDFVSQSFDRYGIWIDCFILMPDHIHLILTISSQSETSLGAWVKAFKAVVARREFKWQLGFFDHVLRSEESRSEKWDYIRANPVRAGFVSDPDQWPYAEYYHRVDGSTL